MKDFCIIDIETIPASDWELFIPDELKQCPSFDMETVKRLKKDTDETYAYKQQESRFEHEAKFKEKQEAWLEKRSLRPLTGQVAVIGINTNGEILQDTTLENDVQNEKANIDYFWRVFKSCLVKGFSIIGFNIKKFDLPFLTLRGLKYGIKPAWSFQDRYNTQILDIAEYFQQGNYDWRFQSFNDVCLYFGLEPKLADGSEFGKLWETDREKALAYNKDELIKLEKVAKIIWG